MEALTDLLNQVQAAPLSLLVIVLLNVIGFTLKSIPQFPNQFIPLTLLIVGGVLMGVFGDCSTVSPSTRYPSGWLAMQGVIFGFLAWALHGVFAKWIGSKIPDTGDAPKPPTMPLIALLCALSLGTGCTTCKAVYGLFHDSSKGQGGE